MKTTPRVATMLGTLVICSLAAWSLLSPSTPPRASVLLITLDTTRADRLGPYGYAGGQTPTYDALAARGTTFERAYAVAPLTIPSHSSIFTGRVPPSHGVRDNSDFVLPASAITLAERFSDAGYATAAFPSAFPTASRWGFDQGFQRYHDPLPGLVHARDWSRQRPADQVIDDALDLLGELDPKRPWFVWVHLFDAHWPYEPPEPHRSAHQDPYDGEIAFADAQVGRLLSWWQEHRAESVVALTADHGESLGEGEEATHGHLLNDGTLHIPLILEGSDFPAGARRGDIASSIDLAPTLLEATGLTVHAEVQGRSLLRTAEATAYSEAMAGYYGLGISSLVASTNAEGRYTRGAWDGLYPATGTKIALVPSPGDATERQAEHEQFVEAFEVVESQRGGSDAATLQALAALGYVSAVGASSRPGVDPRDVIGAVPLTWQIRKALAANDIRGAEAMLTELESALGSVPGVRELGATVDHAAGRYDLAVSGWVDVFLEAPSSGLALRIAETWLELGDPVEAESWARSALELDPDSPEPLAALVRAMQAQGEADLAAALCDEFLDLYPDHQLLSLLLARDEVDRQRPWRALPLAEKAVLAMPYMPWTQSVYGDVWWALGEPERAIDAYKEAIRLAPYDPSLRWTHAEQLLDVGRAAEAWATARFLAAVFEQDPEVDALMARIDQALEAERARGKRR